MNHQWMAFAAVSAMLASSVSAMAMEVKSFPADVKTAEYTVDPSNPLAPQTEGLYETTLKLEDGKEQKIYQYFPAGLAYRQPEVCIAMPDGKDVEGFLEESSWKKTADERGFVLVLLPAPEGGWNADENAYMEAAYTYMDNRTYYKAQDSAFYLVGYAEAGSATMNWLAAHSDLYAGAAVFGLENYDGAVLDEMAETESPKAGVMMNEVEVPIWIGAKEKTANAEKVVNYWIEANDCDDKFPSSNVYADEIYEFPQYLAKTNAITYGNVSKVMVSYGEEDLYNPDFVDYLYHDFLYRVRRQDSGDINALRYFASNDELGMTHEYMEFDGVTREFYVYEPEAVKNGTKTNVPMIIVCHGGGGSGEEFAARSGWPKLAEERNFIAVFPTGPRSGNFCAGTTWNRENVPFIKQVRDYVTENYSVDTTRCYMTGQSMGCLMSSWSAVEIPESFAAIAATDAPMHVPDTYKNDPESIDESVLMPYLFVVGTKDKYFLPGNKDYLTGNETINEYWTKRYGINENNETASKYINGPYEYVLHKTSAGVPITGMMWTRDKIHAQIPDEIRQMYDWMITFSRAEDGTLYYMGEEVVLG